MKNLLLTIVLTLTTLAPMQANAGIGLPLFIAFASIGKAIETNAGEACGDKLIPVYVKGSNVQTEATLCAYDKNPDKYIKITGYIIK